MNYMALIKDALYIGAIVFLCWLFYLERKSLLNRIMARNLQEYEYHDKMYEKDIKEAEKLRNEAREERDVDKEIKEEIDLKYKKEKEVLAKMEEDWSEEEVDFEKLRERING